MRSWLSWSDTVGSTIWPWYTPFTHAVEPPKDVGMPHAFGSGLSGNGSWGTSGSRPTLVVDASETAVSKGTGVVALPALPAQAVPSTSSIPRPRVAPPRLNIHLKYAPDRVGMSVSSAWRRFVRVPTLSETAAASK